MVSMQLKKDRISWWHVKLVSKTALTYIIGAYDGYNLGLYLALADNCVERRGTWLTVKAIELIKETHSHVGTSYNFSPEKTDENTGRNYSKNCF